MHRRASANVPSAVLSDNGAPLRRNLLSGHGRVYSESTRILNWVSSIICYT